MKKIYYIVILILVVLTSQSVFARNIKYPSVFQTTSALNIRQYPYRTSAKLGLLQKNTQVVVDSVHNSRWACITYDGKVAYIATNYIVYQSDIHSGPAVSIIEKLNNSQLAGFIPLTGTPKTVALFFLLFVGVCYVCGLSKACLIVYTVGAILGGIGYYFGGLHGALWVLGIAVGLFLLILFFEHEMRTLRDVCLFFDLILEPIFALNQLQYILQKPWRGLLKNRNCLLSKILKMPPEITPSMYPIQRLCYGIWRVWHYVCRFVFHLLQFALYILCTPLRLFNAILYNIIIHIPCALHDYIAEVFNPKGEGMRHLSRWQYWSQYFLKLPYRFYKFLLKRSILTTLESVIYTLVDVVVPTLTMYHGTSKEAGYKITGDDDVTFKVGNGNYAGSGIYFAIAKDTADHYAKGAIIITRVSLGRVFNVNIAPDAIRNCVACNGLRLTQWGLQQKITTIEWWRDGARWWEYCMLQPSGTYKDSWRIRPLCIENRSTGFKERIYKGMAPWLF